jgi:hypothetical protein
MKRALACVLAVAGWYLLAAPATHKGVPDSCTTLSEWTLMARTEPPLIAPRLTGTI